MVVSALKWQLTEHQSSAATFRAATELFDAALREARAEHELSAARIAKLKAAAALEEAGRVEEARVLVNEVNAERTVAQ